MSIHKLGKGGQIVLLWGLQEPFGIPNHVTPGPSAAEVPTGMAQVFSRTCFRPVVTAIVQTSRPQPTTAQLHSLSQVHVRSVACNLRTWLVRSQQSHIKQNLRGCRALCSASQADVPPHTRRKIVFLGTPEVINRSVLLCSSIWPSSIPLFLQVAADVLFKLFRAARLPEATFQVIRL